MAIKQLDKRDLARAFEFYKEYVGGRSFAVFKHWYGKYPGLFAVCYRGDKLIGFCWGFPRKRLVILSGISIDAKHAGKGLGSRLLKDWEKRIKKQFGKTRISLGSASGYVERFYLKNGYKPVSVHVKLKPRQFKDCA